MSADCSYAPAPAQLLYAVKLSREVVAAAWVVPHAEPAPNLTLYLTGELDCSTVDELQHGLSGLAGLSVHHITVDLSDVEFLGAAGFSFLVSLRDRLDEVGIGMSVGPASSQARRVLAILGWEAWAEAADAAVIQDAPR